MKKVKVKRFCPQSVFKSILMALVIPFMVAFVLIILIVVFEGLSNGGNRGAITAMTLIPLILLPLIYGLVFILLAVSYNWLAPKFGGLEIEIENEEEEEVVL